MGSAVMAPCPISDLARVRVTVPSLAMRTHASNGLGIFFSLAGSWAAASEAKRKLSTKAAPAAVDSRNTRRLRPRRRVEAVRGAGFAARGKRA